ncbi:MAG: hypothetical protein ACYC9T_09895 [Trichloromonadaceae bacterium]
MMILFLMVGLGKAIGGFLTMILDQAEKYPEAARQQNTQKIRLFHKTRRKKMVL